MKLKMIGAIVGVLLAVGVIGVGTIWAQSGGVTTTQGGSTANMQSGDTTDTQSLGATSALTATAACNQFMQSLAQHLGVSVDKLTQASKDASKDMVDQAVKDGRLTPEQATTAKQRIDQAQGGCGFGEHGGFGGFGGRGGPGGPGNPGSPKGPGFPPAGGQRDPRHGQVITGTRSISGATLTQVVADSPAAKAGLQVADVILAVGGQNIDIQHLLDALIRQSKPGDKIELKIQRGSETKTVNVTLGAQPNNATVPYLGIQFEYKRSPT